MRPHRSYALGQALAKAVEQWDEDLDVAIIASGGLSHFVTDEETDRTLLHALETKDADTLRSLPRHRLFSRSVGVAQLGSGRWRHAEQRSVVRKVVDYVPVYRTEAGTGGGWGFARWI